jgi:hypothetical protein
MLPEGPGLGCDLDENIAEEHPYELVNPQPIYEDGSVRDH